MADIPMFVSVIIFSYELSVSVLAVPVIMAVLLKRPSKYAAVVAMCVGAISFLVFQHVDAPISRELISLIGALCSFGFVEGFVAMKGNNLWSLLIDP